ncbi:MAG: DUF531 family protein [Candidatus Thermoplasmatota archaeon]
MLGRAIFGLHNPYDPRRMHEAHRRALAYDLNLATFGFPCGREMIPPYIMRWICDPTTIGEDGGG